MTDVEIDTKAVDSSIAQKLLLELLDKRIISQRRHEELKEKYTRLLDIVMKCITNDKALIKKARELKQDLMNENLTLEKTNAQQKDNEETMKQLNQTIENAATETKQIDDRIKLADFQINILEKQKNECKDLLKAKEDEVKKNLNAEISQLNKDIGDNNADIESHKSKIEKVTTGNEKKEKLILENYKNIAEIKEKIYEQQDIYGKVKDDPIRISKTINIMNKGVEQATVEKEKLDSDIYRLQAERDNLDTLKKQISSKIDTLKQQCKEAEALKKERWAQNEKSRSDNSALSKNIENLRTEQYENSSKIDEHIRTISNQNAMISSLTKECNHKTREHLKIMKECENQRNTLQQLESEEGKLLQKKAEILKEKEEQKKIDENLDDENTLYTESLVKKEDLEFSKAEKIKKLKEEIAEKEGSNNKTGKKEGGEPKEGTLKQLKEKEQQAHEKIKFLTAIREKMARTASQANDQVRQKKEEMKIKDLLINDLIKKEQETKLSLDRLIIWYEQVKNERNKFVNLIQNCSQNLAEQKERIKILQNEYEILRNESSEKDHSLVEVTHKKQKQIYMRDNKKAELEKIKKELKDLESLTEQKVNEQGKLSVVFGTIEKEVKSLMDRYELACESRNMMGINLIDRNDELCILYEKANIQDAILKKGENSIHSKEEEIRMLNLELNERQRKILVLRKKIPEVPKLANEVNNLKTELDHERQLVAQLSEEIENPKQNKDGETRIRKLESEIPDQDTLKAKIQVLEERLNSKKEALLEKELVLEEISNITEKMRQQTIDGRKSILELGEKINEFKAKTSDLSRQMLATVAELSMYQASALKLEQEKCEREKILTDASDRFTKGMPPTDDDEEEWKRRIRQEDQRSSILVYTLLESADKAEGRAVTATAGEDNCKAKTNNIRFYGEWAIRALWWNVPIVSAIRRRSEYEAHKKATTSGDRNITYLKEHNINIINEVAISEAVGITVTLLYSEALTIFYF